MAKKSRNVGVFPFVSFWSKGVLVTAMMKNEDAKKMVSDSKAFVITDGQIGRLNEKGERDS